MIENVGQSCPICASIQVQDHFSLHGVPTQDGVIWETRAQALAAPRGDIDISMCGGCGYIWNRSHDGSKVKFVGYDVSLQHSQMFQSFTRELVQRLGSRYGLSGKTVLDLGCGKGHFLSALCSAAGCKGIGFDPSYSADGAAPSPSLEFIQDYYSEKYAHHQAALITCRHVVDILDDPLGFISTLRKSIGSNDTVVYFESPDAHHTFGKLILWNLVYEHKSWFTVDSYTAFFEQGGYQVLDSARCWNDEYIGLEARPRRSGQAARKSDPGRIADSRRDLERFSSAALTTMSDWRARLDQLRASGRSAAAWGAGARAIAWLNLFDLTDLVPTIVDINPRRQGKFLPLTGHQVQQPEQLQRSMPDVLFITNPTYEAEIREHARSLGFTGEYVTL